MVRILPLIWLLMSALMLAQADPPEVKSVDDVRALDESVTAVSGLVLREADAVAEALAARGGLTEVRFRLCRTLTAKGVAHLLDIPGLRKLDLAMCAQLRDADIEILTRDGALTHLDLSMCPTLSDDLLARIIAHHPLVEFTAGGTGTQRAEFGAKSVRALAKKRSLRVLQLAACEPDAKAQRVIAGLKGLEALRLVQMKIDAKAFSRLASTKTLRRLELIGVRVEGKFGPVLARCAGVEHLQLLNMTGVARKDLGALARFRRLKALGLSGEGLVGDRQLAALAKCPSLDEVSLGGGELAAKTLARCGGKDGLHALELTGTRVRGGYAALAKRHQSLRRVSISGDDGFDDDDLRALTAAPQIEDLQLCDLPRISDRGMEALSEWPALSSLTIANVSSLTSACLPSLREIENLDRLSLGEDDGWDLRALRALKVARPKVRLTLD